MLKEAMKNAVLKYPIYMKKQVLKQFIDQGLIMNMKNSPEQITLNFANIVDVSDDTSIDDKIRHIFSSDDMIGYIEEYEYRKQYRHFCYFKFDEMKNNLLQTLIKENKLKVCDKKEHKAVDTISIPTISVLEDIIYLKFSYLLDSDISDKIKYPIIAIIDTKQKIVELRLDRVGIAYKNSYNFYREKIDEICKYFKERLEINLINIDFKSVIDYIKHEKDDVTIYAQRMQRNGTTAYLEAYTDDNCIMPILGELSGFIEEKKDMFEVSDDTKKIKLELDNFIQEIEEKSDLPVVKVKMDTEDIKFGITHEYKGAKYSLFMLYGDLDKERMKYVREYVIKCYNELNQQVSAHSLSGEES